VICDRDLDGARHFRDDFGYRLASNSIHTVLREIRPDAIVCTVQPSNTFELVQSLLPLRIPLLIEKPPGVSAIEANALADAAAAAGTFTFVAFNRRFIPSIVRLKQWSSEHPILFARAEMLRTNRLESQFITATGIHALDAIRFLMGNPKSIEVRSRQHDNSPARDYWVRMTFANSATAEISMMVNTGLRRESYLLTAAGASAEATLGSPYSTTPCFQGDRQWFQEQVVEQHSLANDPLEDDGIIGEYEEFIRLLDEGKVSTSSLSDAACSMQLAEAVQNGHSGTLPFLSVKVES